MSDYTQLYKLLSLTNPDSARLWKQASYAILVAARDIRNEDSGTTNHANRLTWALEAEQDTTSKLNQMKVRILENATIAEAPTTATDNDVQYVVNSLINTYATGE